jgi:Ca2+-binding RTX toxin-like protein
MAGAAVAAVLAFPGIASAAVTSGVANGALTVSSDADDPIEIICDAGSVKINGDNPDSGAANCAAITSIDVTGGPDDNDIDLSGVTAAAFPTLASVLVNGGAGDDDIEGSELADRLIGGVNDDDVSGNGGNDTIVWNPGHDSDLNEGGDGADTIEVNGGGAGEQFTVKPSGIADRVQFDRTGPTPPGPFTLDIGTAERLDMNANAGDDTFTADAGLDALGFALDVDGGPGNDNLDGGDGPDLIKGGDGNDRIVPDDNPLNTRDDARGDAGDDTIVWNGGDDDDLNEGGDGNDTSEVNGAGAPEEFTVKPSATAGRVIFDRLATPGPGPFNIDMGTTERLDLNMNGGDDKVTADSGFASPALDVDGGDGNDSIDGSDAADTLSGGNGNDRIAGDDNPLNTRDIARGDAGDDAMVWNPGDDDDVNDGGDGNDTSEVNGGGVAERFTVKPSATPGRVAFDRLATPGPGPFNVDIGTTENLVLNAGGGNDSIQGAKKGLAGLIKSTLNGDDGNDSIRGTDGKDALNGGNGSDLLRSKDKAEDQVDCGAAFDIARVDKLDVVRDCNLAFGGKARVRSSRRALVTAGGVAAMKLTCVGGRKCKGVVRLQRNGKRLGTKRFTITRKSKVVRVKLNRRGRRLMANAPARGRSVRIRIDAKDKQGNGWRTSAKLKLKR